MFFVKSLQWYSNCQLEVATAILSISLKTWALALIRKLLFTLPLKDPIQEKLHLPVNCVEEGDSSFSSHFFLLFAGLLLNLANLNIAL